MEARIGLRRWESVTDQQPRIVKVDWLIECPPTAVVVDDREPLANRPRLELFRSSPRWSCSCRRICRSSDQNSRCSAAALQATVFQWRRICRSAKTLPDRRLRLRLHFGFGFTWPFDRFAGKLRLPDHGSSRFRLIAFSSQYPPANGNSVRGWISILSFSCNAASI
jgi:hypothetical protein